MNIRKKVQSELKRQGLSRYKLCQMVKGHMSESMVYKYLSGAYSISDDKLGVILDVLDLTIIKSP